MMETDRDWDIAVLEIQLKNEELIAEFLESRLRPRELQQIVEEVNADRRYSPQAQIGEQGFTSS